MHSLNQQQFYLYVAQENVAVDAKPVALPNGFEATVQAVEEAIINAMVAAETMEGTNGKKASALPHKLVIDT